MRRSSVVLAIVVTACALGCAAARPQPARALSSSDLRMKQGVQLLKGYIDAQGARHGFLYPTSTQVRKGGGLIAPIWPLSPFSGLPLAPGAAAGHYTYTVAADRQSYALAGHLSKGRTYTVRGASPAWLAAERAKDAAALTKVSDEVVKVGTEYIASIIDRFAVDNNDAYPAAGMVAPSTMIESGQPLYDYWPVNPWYGTVMCEGSGLGSYLYTLPSASSFALTGHLSSTDFTVGESATTDPIVNGLLNEQDRAAEAGCQALKDYVDEWALAHDGALPGVDQLTPTGAVGLAHAWWPTDPFSAAGNSMEPGAQEGNYAYTPGGDGTFTVTVNLVASSKYPASYTAE